MEDELAHTNWQWTSPGGGLNLWVQLPNYLSTESLLTKSLSHSISFVPGQVCDPHKELLLWMRLSYSYTNENQLHEGVKKLIQVAKLL
jgi:DNA-binding transcriptional MocR family regulator